MWGWLHQKAAAAAAASALVVAHGRFQLETRMIRRDNSGKRARNNHGSEASVSTTRRTQEVVDAGTNKGQ